MASARSSSATRTSTSRSASTARPAAAPAGSRARNVAAPSSAEVVVVPHAEDNEEAPGQAGRELPQLSPFEFEIVGLYGDLAQLIGLPRAEGMIYGLLFASPTPLGLSDFQTKLELSKAAVNASLRALVALGAIAPAGEGAKADAYVARLELRAMLGEFIRDQVDAQMRSSRQRIKRLKAWLAAEEAAAAGKPDETLTAQRQRLDKLHHWHKKAANIVPWAGKFLA